MFRFNVHTWPYSILLGLALALALSLRAGGVASPPPCGPPGNPCSESEQYLLTDALPDAVAGSTGPSGQVEIIGAQIPTAGLLTYSDFKQVEQQARALLKHGLEARVALSPYQGNLEFSEYVAKFDYEAGWKRDYTGTTPYTETLTLMGLIDKADEDLRQARDLYAYLLVYAPEHRFRADSTYAVDQAPPDYSDYWGASRTLCGDPEQPDPPDPAHTGQVLDPVIDWCNFRARLRQSVREAAYLRMIFGQQFMADALGLQFSGTTLLGAENAVRQETARLRAAKYQYELAEQGLAEALDRALGSGCYVSDFYTQSEWSLLSRAIEGQETAQHHLAIRLSYLDVPQQPDGPQQTRDAGVDALRAAMTDGYVKLIGMAGLGAGQPTGAGCAVGERPDGQLAAEMALNLLETRRKAHEMADGRNMFGFDVAFTPAHPYKSIGETRGLWDMAKDAAELAQQLQDAEAAATREYNDKQAELLTEVGKIRDGIDAQIAAKSGCSVEEWTCVDQQIEELNTCLGVITSTVTATGLSPFDTCMNRPVILNSDAKRALLDLRSVYVQMLSIQTKASDIDERIQLSDDRNVAVKGWLAGRGAAETAARASEAFMDFMGCIKAGSVDPVTGASVTSINASCGVAYGINTALQATAGAISTAADVAIEDAEHHREIENMLLDQSELFIDMYAASQQYASKLSEYISLLDSLRDDVIEAQRQRAYFAHSPANDPSFRIVRDSTRLQFANQLAKAARLTYLAARRAEYEYAARLSASNVRYSDIYRARTAADLLTFLGNLGDVTELLAGGPSYAVQAQDLTFSVARHWLNLTDEALAQESFTTPAAAQAERTRRFRLWVAENTVPNDFESPYDGKPVLRFNFATSLVEGGTFARLIQQGYDGYWLIKLSGIAKPEPLSNGLSVNLPTEQPGMSYRKTRIAQGGLVHLRSQAGCIFDYRLIAPAWLLKLEWPASQDPATVSASFSANVNGEHAYAETGFRADAFLGRAASTTDWQVLVFAASPTTGLGDMDLQQLTDIELIFSITYASRTPGTPEPSECTRIDW